MYYRAGEEGSDQNRMVMNLGVKWWREFSTFSADVLNKKILHFEGYFAISTSKVSPGRSGIIIVVFAVLDFCNDS